MKKLLVSLVTSALTVSGPAEAQQEGETYAIQSVLTGKNLRPQGAKSADRTGIVLYDHHAWRCMTWRFLPVEGNAYRLQNRWTDKTLQPSASPAPRVTLWQQPLRDDGNQAWEFIPDGNAVYRIRLKDTGLYVTATFAETNSVITLMPRNNSNAQQWRLVPQDPWF